MSELVGTSRVGVGICPLGSRIVRGFLGEAPGSKPGPGSSPAIRQAGLLLSSTLSATSHFPQELCFQQCWPPS